MCVQYTMNIPPLLHDPTSSNIIVPPATPFIQPERSCSEQFYEGTESIGGLLSMPFYFIYVGFLRLVNGPPPDTVRHYIDGVPHVNGEPI